MVLHPLFFRVGDGRFEGKLQLELLGDNPIPAQDGPRPVEQFREDQAGLLLALRRVHAEHQRQCFPAFRTDVAIHAFVDVAADPPDADERVRPSPLLVGQTVKEHLKVFTGTVRSGERVLFHGLGQHFLDRQQ